MEVEGSCSQRRSIIHDGTLVTSAPIRRLSLSLLVLWMFRNQNTNSASSTEFHQTYQTSKLLSFDPIQTTELLVSAAQRCPKMNFAEHSAIL